MTEESKAPWHILEASSVPALEFASALGRLTPVIGWLPELKWLGFGGSQLLPGPAGEPLVKLVRFPLQKGYSQPAVARTLGLGGRLQSMLLDYSPNPSASPVICTSPFFAPAVEGWPGPVIYYSLDFTYAYEGLNAETVLKLERGLCQAAQLVCPVSTRIADYLIERAGCPPGKISVLPNGTRAVNIRAFPAENPDPLPESIAHLKRPIAGVIGNMADNVDWELLHNVITQNAAFTWLFVGPTHMKIRDAHRRKMRSAVMSLGRRVCFAGEKPYSELYRYARSLDVAVMPYRRREPTYSGSATRYYEHLAAGRPMIATRGVAQLECKEPLLQLVDNSPDLLEALEALRRSSFRDGLATARWRASREHTWNRRAETMLNELQSRMAKAVEAEPERESQKPSVRSRA